MKYVIFLLFVSGILLSSCNQNTSSIENQLLQKCIAAHGGMEKWQSLEKTDYTKHIVLYYEDGTIEKEMVQKHHYTNTPHLSGSIEWSDTIHHRVFYQDGTAYEVKGDERQASSPTALNTFNSAYYVLNMPWKLADGTAEISYEGIDTILNDKIVHTLSVEYPSESQNDVWEYYLDQNSFFLVANKVQHGSTYSLITNDEYAWYKGLRFNAKRTSYMVDSLGEVLYMRAKYEYQFMSDE
jgi:hypothetical protein